MFVNRFIYFFMFGSPSHGPQLLNLSLNCTMHIHSILLVVVRDNIAWMILFCFCCAFALLASHSIERRTTVHACLSLIPFNADFTNCWYYRYSAQNLCEPTTDNSILVVGKNFFNWISCCGGGKKKFVSFCRSVLPDDSCNSMKMFA